MSRLGAFFGNLMVRRPARRLTLAELTVRLEESGVKLAARCARASGTDAHRARLRHIIGIERWGQRRLGMILGQEPIADEYDGYRPDATLDWSALRDALAATRQETVALARWVAAASIGDDVRARHNDLGDLNAREWLYYLNNHANREGLTIR
jgi:hypothetical protein